MPPSPPSEPESAIGRMLDPNAWDLGMQTSILEKARAEHATLQARIAALEQREREALDALSGFVDAAKIVLSARMWKDGLYRVRFSDMERLSHAHGAAIQALSRAASGEPAADGEPRSATHVEEKNDAAE